MNLDIYQELLTHCELFSNEMKKSELLKHNNHLVVDVEKFIKDLSLALESKRIKDTTYVPKIDFTWVNTLKEFIKIKSSEQDNDIKLLNLATNIVKYANTINNYLQQRLKLSRVGNGSIISDNEESINSIIELKTTPLLLNLSKVLISNQESIEILSELKETRSGIDLKQKEIELNLKEGISNVDLNNNAKLSEIKSSLDDRINKLSEEKLKRAESIYNQTLSLSSSIAGKVIANDFSKSAEREKFWADWLRITGFIVLALTAAIIFYSNKNFSLVNPKEISSAEFIHLIKASVISIFLISLSILCLKEASKHRVQQYFYENQALKIASLSPLIADLEKEKQELVKQDVAKSLFAMEQKISISDDSSSAFLGMTKILEKLLDKK